MSATLYVYDEIGPSEWGLVGPKSIAAELQEIDPDEHLTVRINSPGGSVFDALAIRQLLAEHPGPKVFKVDALAASAATILNGPGDQVQIAKGGRWMIHDPWTIAVANAKEMREIADKLDQTKVDILDIYEANVDGATTRAELSEMMAAETLLTAEQARDAGFVDIVDNQADRIAACWRPGIFSQRLDDLFAQEPTQHPAATQRQQAARQKVRRGPSAIEKERLRRVASPQFWNVRNP